MRLKGSCRCQAVEFECESKHPYPYQPCYCSICRKTAGGGGYAINLGADFSSLKLKGEENISVYQAILKRGSNGKPQEVSEGQRHFCKHCSSALWMYDPRWPELVHPHASAVDTDLPIPPERTHCLLGSKAAWVVPTFGLNDKKFEGYPEESLEQWHKRLGLEC